jgi:filamentous hemagglutinin family protein
MKQHAAINRIYRLVWNEAARAWVAVAETSRRRGKRAGSARSTAVLASLCAVAAHAGPTGGQVTAGSGNISQSANTTTVNQSSQNLSLNWQTFNVASQEAVNFVQPNSAAVAVNRILDTNGSVILGHLNANGQVYLITPTGC